MHLLVPWSAPIAAKVSDRALNLSISTHAVLADSSSIPQAANDPIDVDERIGPQTLGAVQAATDRGAAGEVLAALKAEATGVYRRLVRENPQFEKWKRGWLRRAYDEWIVGSTAWQDDDPILHFRLD